ncbi:MAG: T9SS type A sorting domain-containing protein [Bacteroidetes bacterium]|nr:T9SS type A sorting domain-containing protein [Bacteroidota bacterium]
MRNLPFILLFLFIGTLKSQSIDSIKVLNGSFITTIDTIRIKVYTMSGEGGTIQSNNHAINGGVISGTVHMCSGNLSLVTYPTTIIKVNPLPQGTYKIKIKLMDYDNFFSPGCNVLKISVSDSLNINVQLFNGITEINPLTNNITLQPNPFSNEIFVNNLLESNYMGTICNSLGQNVFEKSFSNQNERIDLSFLPIGLYYFKAHDSNSSKVFKIIKN